jgi:hypothetical protein
MYNNLSLINRDLGDLSLVVYVDYRFRPDNWTACGLRQPKF